MQWVERTAAVVPVGALRGIHKTTVRGRRTIDRRMGLSEGLGHFPANRLLVK